MGYSAPGDLGADLLYFDIETAPMMGAADWLEVPEAPANYKDEAKIAAYKEAAAAKELERTSLDLDLCRVVAIGAAHNAEPVMAFTVQNGTVQEEAALLENFWDLVRVPGRVLVGFNCLAFDLPILVRRSQYLRVPVPWLNIGKYRHSGIMDVMQILSFDGMVRARSQGFYCKRFGITVGSEDTHTGADIAALVEAGDWEAIRTHVTADVEKLRALFTLVVGRGWTSPQPAIRHRARRACEVCGKTVAVLKTGRVQKHRCIPRKPTNCEHGVDILQPCEACQRLVNTLADDVPQVF